MPINGKKVLFFLAQENFRDEEAEPVFKILKEEGAAIGFASSVAGDAVSMAGKNVKSMALSSLKPTNFDAVIFIGGIGLRPYFKDPIVVDFARQAYLHRKVVAAIGTAPSILANSGILDGRKATAYLTEQGNLMTRGVNYTGRDLEIAGNIVTAKSHQSAYDFGIAILRLLESQ